MGPSEGFARDARGRQRQAGDSEARSVGKGAVEAPLPNHSNWKRMPAVKEWVVTWERPTTVS